MQCKEVAYRFDIGQTTFDLGQDFIEPLRLFLDITAALKRILKTIPADFHPKAAEKLEKALAAIDFFDTVIEKLILQDQHPAYILQQLTGIPELLQQVEYRSVFIQYSFSEDQLTPLEQIVFHLPSLYYGFIGNKLGRIGSPLNTLLVFVPNCPEKKTIQAALDSFNNAAHQLHISQTQKYAAIVNKIVQKKQDT